MKYFMLLISVFMLGCASAPHQKLMNLNPPLNSVDGPIKLRQQLSIQSENENRDFEVVVSKTKSELQVVGLTTMGAQIFSMKYNGSEIQISNPKMKSLAELILSDIYIANMSIDKLVQYLPADYKISEDKNTRTISYADQELVRVLYKEKRAWSDELTLWRPSQKYKIMIKTLDKL